ncbi:RNA-directed DNA polymerase, eukaryota, reverse transcriptase zinc-binding domain protein, partial [Tanacetum coccineum]
VDFENAFNSVNWSFLLYVMEKIGFGVKWRRWIKGCISSASVSILINGSPSCKLIMERGLRQGDPLSPFLFLIVAEALQVIMLEAYDALIFEEWSPKNVKNLISILKGFGDASGFKKAILADCDKGGLGIGSIKAKNISLLGKWWCQFLLEKDALWRKVIAAIHGVDVGFFERVAIGLKKDVWKSIISCGAVVDDLNINFKSSFILTIETNKNASLSKHWCCFDGVWGGLWSWTINLRGRSKSDLELLTSYLQGVELRVLVKDGLLWSLD